MSLQILSSDQLQHSPPKINLLVYGMPGVGKTSFAARTEDVLIADVEHGAKLLGLHGIKADVATISKWEDMQELYAALQGGKYKTVVIDPIGELLDKLLTSLKVTHGTKGGEALSLQGWGLAKERFRSMIRAFRDLDVNVVLVAHSSEKKEEDMLHVRPKLQANLDEDVCAMMDIVGYLKIVTQDKQKIRRLFTQPTDKYYAKDRSGLLPEFIDDPSFDKMAGIIKDNDWFKIQKAAEKSMDDFEKSLDAVPLKP